MSVSVKIYDSNLEIVADLQNAFNVSYNKRLNELWEASFELPVEDDKTDLFDLLDFAEIYDGGKRVELFRINRKIPQRDTEKASIKYECKHVLDTLNDDYILDTTRTVDGTSRDHQSILKTGTDTAITYILGEQTNANWQKGTIDFSKNFQHEFKHQTLLRALLDVPKPWWEDFEITFDTRSYPWTLNVEQPNTTPKGTIRYGKNMQSIEREISAEKLITKLYAYGDGSGDERIAVGPFTSNVATYGTHVGIFEEQYFDDVGDLETAANKYLNKSDTPRVEYRGEAVDLYRLSSINHLDLGEYITIYDPDLSFDTKVRVVNLSKNDVRGDPGSLSFELSNKSKQFPSYGSLAFRDKATEDNMATGSVGGGALGGGSVSPNNLNHITMDNIEPGVTYDRVLKTDISAGHILLSEAQGEFGDIDGDIDQVPDGATYSRVKTTDIKSGHIALEDTYKIDGATKADLDDLSDGSTYGRIDISALSSAKPLLSQAAGNLDDISDGASYGKVAVTDISSGHIQLSTTTGNIDDIANGVNYGKVNLTDIQSGSIVLSSAVGDIDDVSDGTSYRRAPDGWFYSTTTINGGKIETNTLSVGQVYIDQDIDMSESGFNKITNCENIFGSGSAGIGLFSTIELGGNTNVSGDLDMFFNDIITNGLVAGHDLGSWSKDTLTGNMYNPSASYEEVQLADGSTINAFLLTSYSISALDYISH